MSSSVRCAYRDSSSAVVASVQAVGARWRLALQDDLAVSYARDAVVVHGNAALATHGETVKQLLGSGRASQAFHRFTLAYRPLDARGSRIMDTPWAARDTSLVAARAPR